MVKTTNQLYIVYKYMYIYIYIYINVMHSVLLL